MVKDNQNKDTHLALFKSKSICRTLFQKEWWFLVVDVVETLTDSPDPDAYWKKLKHRLIEERSGVVTFCHWLKLEVLAGN